MAEVMGDGALQVGNVNVFSMLSEAPVAAASLGQVYRGRLRRTGEEVAVKVHHEPVPHHLHRCAILNHRA